MPTGGGNMPYCQPRDSASLNLVSIGDAIDWIVSVIEQYRGYVW